MVYPSRRSRVWITAVDFAVMGRGPSFPALGCLSRLEHVRALGRLPSLRGVSTSRHFSTRACTCNVIFQVSIADGLNIILMYVTTHLLDYSEGHRKIRLKL